ncbi:MAG: hypothetical protein PHF60_03080 [Candidatus ainarchaeum sp.]|nr:hypothetical protein [Candidatus ainarchaeum sp.]
MAGAIVKREIVVPNAPALALAKGFGGYRPEAEKPVRTMRVVKDASIQKLEKAYREIDRFESQPNLDYITNPEGFYEKLCESLLPHDLPNSASDIERFSVHLGSLQSERYFFEKTGFFLSFLMECSADRKFMIHTSHLEQRFSYLGFKNSKRIIVNGYGGESLGAYMKDGSITVDGDTAGDVGHCMKGGAIIISGDAHGSVGSGMTGGRIVIGGDAGNRIGSSMKHGRIFIKGNCGKAGARMTGGAICIGGDADGMIGDGMKGGIIKVAGNSGYGVGYSMRGGRIDGAGNVGDKLGYEMRGGEIHVEGDIGNLGWTCHRKIYHKGVRITDK